MCQLKQMKNVGVGVAARNQDIHPKAMFHCQHVSDFKILLLHFHLDTSDKTTQK